FNRILEDHLDQYHDLVHDHMAKARHNQPSADDVEEGECLGRGKLADDMCETRQGKSKNKTAQQSGDEAADENRTGNHFIDFSEYRPSENVFLEYRTKEGDDEYHKRCRLDHFYDSGCVLTFERIAEYIDIEKSRQHL